MAKQRKRPEPAPYRRFNPLVDGAAWFASQARNPGEGLAAYAEGGIQRFNVKGRLSDGSRSWLAVVALPLAALIVFGSGGNISLTGDSRNPVPPRVIAFGPRPSCRAIIDPKDPELTAAPGLWVFTDHRIAYARFAPGIADADERKRMTRRLGAEALPLEPITPSIEFQVGLREVQFARVQHRFGRKFTPREAVYDRVLLSDGSGFDFIAGTLPTAMMPQHS
ncbi:hypothetical protein [Glycomyces sp. NPDC048151]|uniref:hypothetical protein n=1 Tax=Glycomyces sp. NPDC048151 TaxID=3364002 RepID=UPI0037185448